MWQMQFKEREQAFRMTEFEMFDGRVVAPMLRKLAKERGKTYEEAKKIFIDEFAKGSIDRFKKVIEEVFSRDGKI